VQDRLLTYGSLNYQYDALGERTTRVTDNTNRTKSYIYDSLGALETFNRQYTGNVAADQKWTASFAYLNDGLGRRIEKRKNGVLTARYVYDESGRIIAELDVNGKIISQFVYATRLNSPDSMIKNGVNFKIVHDQLGSVRMVVKVSTGEIISQIDYDEFGVVKSSTRLDFQPFGFAGGLYDQASELVRFGARDYDPVVGRWVSKDPSLFFNGGGVNLYGYSFNDPVNLIDVNGMYPDDPAYIPGPAGTQGVDPNAYNQGVYLGAAAGAALDAGALGAALLPIEILGPGGGGRIIGIRIGDYPPLRIDNGPIDWTGESTLHYHTPFEPSVHNPMDPFSFPNPQNSCEPRN
jgi:RHS repeat-associated protein